MVGKTMMCVMLVSSTPNVDCHWGGNRPLAVFDELFDADPPPEPFPPPLREAFEKYDVLVYPPPLPPLEPSNCKEEGKMRRFSSGSVETRQAERMAGIS